MYYHNHPLQSRFSSNCMPVHMNQDDPSKRNFHFSITRINCMGMSKKVHSHIQSTEDRRAFQNRCSIILHKYGNATGCSISQSSVAVQILVKLYSCAQMPCNESVTKVTSTKASHASVAVGVQRMAIHHIQYLYPRPGI